MKPFDLSGFKGFSAAAIFFAAAIFLFFQPVIACSWDYDIWQVRSKNADPLYRFIKNGKAGYIDQTGKIVIQPTLEFYGNYHGEFNDGLLLTGLNDGAYIDPTGKVVLDTKFDVNWGFSDGLAAVLVEDDGKWGYMDKTGRLVISPRFEGYPNGSVSSFSNGFALIEVKDKHGYIDRTGEFVIPPKFLESEGFSEGFARVVLEGPCFYIGDGGCAAVNGKTVGGEMPANEDAPMCKFAFIDKSGKLIGNERFVRAGNFSEGLAAVMPNGNWNPFNFDKDNGKWGFIDAAGKLVIKAEFNRVGEFSEGLAAVKIGEKWGFIDKQGKIVIAPQFDKVQNFADGLAPVGEWNEKKKVYTDFYYINKEGKPAFPGKFMRASHYFKGVAHVKLIEPGKKYNDYRDGKYAYLDVTGRKIFTYERIGAEED